jgi:hypothetical protein
MAGIVIATLPLVNIHSREEHKGDELHGAEPGEQPVEVVEVSAVQVVREPARPALRRGLVNDGDEEAAEEVPDPEDAQEQGQPEAARRVGDLVVEELLQPDHGEHVGHADEDVLRDHPPEAHRELRLWGVHQAGVPRDAEPFHLHERGQGHGDEREGQAGADPLQHGDTRRPPRAAPREGHEEPVVHRDEDDDADTDECLQRRRRHLELRADPAVQRRGLLREERRRLGEDDGVDYARRPYREQPEHALDLFDGGGVAVFFADTIAENHKLSCHKRCTAARFSGNRAIINLC